MGVSREDMIMYASLLEEQAVRASRLSLLPFIKYMFPSEYLAKWYHQYVCSVFDRFAAGAVNRLMVFMPPQHGKSTMMTEYLPAWLLGNNPNEKIILVTYNAELSGKFNRKIQRIIDNEKYNRVFPSTKLNAKNIVTSAKGAYVRNSSEFEIVGYEGSLRSTGVGGGIAGMPAKTALLDDVIKNAEEAYSETYRRKVYEWYTDELEARLHNDSKVAFTITRRHEEDLAGKLLERDGTVENGGKWTVIKLPALKEDNDSDYDIRKIGEALFPEKHSRERMEYVRDKSPRTFASLYQQRPAPTDGNIIKRDHFVIADIHSIPDAVRNAVKNFVADTAYTEKKENDPSACIPYVEYDNKVYLFDYLNKRLEFSGLVKRIEEYIKEWGKRNSALYVEGKASGLSVIQYLKKHTGINAIKYELPKGDKVARLNGVEPFLEAQKVVLIKGAWNEAFITECLVFPNGKHDEAVDLLTMILNLAFMKLKPQKRKVRKIKL